jgi:hypothetical protein
MQATCVRNHEELVEAAINPNRPRPVLPVTIAADFLQLDAHWD